MSFKESPNDEVFITHLDTLYYYEATTSLGESYQFEEIAFQFNRVFHCFTQSLGEKCQSPATWIERLICQEKLKNNKKCPISSVVECMHFFATTQLDGVTCMCIKMKKYRGFLLSTLPCFLVLYIS